MDTEVAGTSPHQLEHYRALLVYFIKHHSCDLANPRSYPGRPYHGASLPPSADPAPVTQDNGTRNLISMPAMSVIALDIIAGGDHSYKAIYIH